MSTVTELKSEYDSAVLREKDLYTTWRSKELLIAFSAVAMAESTFKDDPAFDYIRQLSKESKEAQAQYSEQIAVTSAAFDRYSSAHRADLMEAADVL